MKGRLRDIIGAAILGRDYAVLKALSPYRSAEAIFDRYGKNINAISKYLSTKLKGAKKKAFSRLIRDILSKKGRKGALSRYLKRKKLIKRFGKAITPLSGVLGIVSKHPTAVAGLTAGAGAGLLGTGLAGYAIGKRSRRRKK